jgi:acyl transferase domain-containing protein
MPMTWPQAGTGDLGTAADFRHSGRPDRCLADKGVAPAMVLGHSVGEITAAYAAGIITLDQAARILMARADSQEAVHNAGTMAAMAANRTTIADLIRSSGIEDLDIAADNGPSSVTISGTDAAVLASCGLPARAASPGASSTSPTPITRLLAGIEGAFHAELGEISPGGHAADDLHRHGRTAGGRGFRQRLLVAEHPA